jgi:uncharacterized protein (DUF1015 family)
MRRMAVDNPTSENSLPSSPTPAAGLDLAPVRGVRYATRDGADLARLTCPPYDVIDDDQRAVLESADPRNVVRLILPRDDESGPGTRYRNAALTLNQWLADGVLAVDAEPGLYAYEMAERDDGTAVRGLIGSLRLLDASAGVVLPHEDTMPGPVRHRLELIEATGANLEPIFLVTDGAPGAAADAVRRLSSEPPLASLRAPDGSSHRLWAITDPSILADITADLLPRRALIADGHHRYEAYLQHRAAQRRDGHATGPWDRGLAFLVDASAFGARVQAFHRVVLEFSWDEALDLARTAFDVTELEPGLDMALPALEAAGAAGTAFVMTDGEQWVLLTSPAPAALAAALPKGHSSAWRELDVVALHQLLLGTTWNIEITEQTVRYVADPVAAVHLAVQRRGVAVLLNPTPFETVLAVAAAGERMPQKSTLFAPKPRTGLVLRTYADDNGVTKNIGPAR